MSKRKWRGEEVTSLFRLFAEHGCKWQLISRKFELRSDVSVKNTFFSSMKKILRSLALLAGVDICYTALRRIKSRILHEFFQIYFRFFFDDGKEIFVSVKEIVFSALKGNEHVLQWLSGCLRDRVLTSLLDCLFAFNEEYVKREKSKKSKIRKFRFLKGRVFERRIAGIYTSDEFVDKRGVVLKGWRREFAVELPFVKKEFVKSFFESEKKQCKGQKEKLESFFRFHSLTASILNRLKNDSDNVLFIEKTASFFRKLDEIIFMKEFREFSTKKEEEEFLQNMLKTSDDISYEFFFGAGDCGLQDKGGGLCESFSSIGKEEEFCGKDFDFTDSFEEIKKESVLNGSCLDVMSLLSCERINNEYGDNYCKKQFDVPLIDFDE